MFVKTINLKIGGSLKKLNSIDKNWLILGIVLPILCFFLSMASVYAYFTASVSQEEMDFTTAVINIGFTNDTTATINNQTFTAETKLLPGQTLNITGKVKNTGTADVYIILKFDIFVTKVGESQTNVHSKFYTFENSTLTELTFDPSSYETAQGAYNLTYNKTTSIGSEIAFALNYEFDFYEYDNSFQNADMHYEVNAYGIQVKNVDDASLAAKLLIEKAIGE